MPLRIGGTFNGYQVLQLLVYGGMGEFYLVERPLLPRQEALKVLRPNIYSKSVGHGRSIHQLQSQPRAPRPRARIAPAS